MIRSALTSVKSFCATLAASVTTWIANSADFLSENAVAITALMTIIVGVANVVNITLNARLAKIKIDNHKSESINDN